MVGGGGGPQPMSVGVLWARGKHKLYIKCKGSPLPSFLLYATPGPPPTPSERACDLDLQNQRSPPAHKLDSFR